MIYKTFYQSDFSDVTEIDLQGYLRPFVVNSFRLTSESVEDFYTVDEFVDWIDRDEKIESILSENTRKKIVEFAASKYGHKVGALQKVLSEAIEQLSKNNH